MQLATEELMLRQIAAGDQQAFSELYDRYRPVLYRFVYGILKSSDLTKDACQEVFIRIWEDRQRLDQVQSFRYYLLTAGKNQSLNMLKKVVSEERTLSGFVRQYRDVQTTTPEETLQAEDYQRFLQSVLATLPPQSRRVFELCRQQGLSYDEVADLLGVSRNIVKKHMVRSMKVLRLAVERDLGITFSVFLATVFRS
ncbi:MAG: RNA polymerase sigma-70 factor [Siphonobacter aquaeclarae]|nr:RNA polymerase sigma-70 factor [Siphonobacter aquaeclarae]